MNKANSTDKLSKLVSLCKCGVHVTINAHRDMYESASEDIANREEFEGESIEVDDNVRETMIKTNTIVEVQFYPSTPVGFYRILHFDLDEALDQALGCFPNYEASHE